MLSKCYYYFHCDFGVFSSYKRYEYTEAYYCHTRKKICRTYDLVSRTYDLASRFTTMPTYTHNISSLILEVETQNWYQIEA